MMNYKDWEKILTKELNGLWVKSQRFLPCHGPNHHLRVWKSAEPFGKKKGADLEVLMAACLLHDVSSFNPILCKGHDLVSAKIAAPVLKKVKFPDQKIKQVVRAIHSHRSSHQGGNLMEGQIMKSFDKLDAFGPIGVYRIITPLSVRKYPIEEIVYWVLESRVLERKWNSIPFPELKKKFLPDYKYTLKYFKDLAKKLKISKIRKSSFLEEVMYYEED